jgi:hypothetical protein
MFSLFISCVGGERGGGAGGQGGGAGGRCCWLETFAEASHERGGMGDRGGGEQGSSGRE